MAPFGEWDMEFFEAVRRRRSVRKYTAKTVPADVMHKAFEAAQLAPNSSNLQTSEFIWVKSPEAKAKLVEACLGQNAAATAQELVVVVSRVDTWRAHCNAILEVARAGGANPVVEKYYGKLIPFLYGYRWLAPLKIALFAVAGLFKPTPRRPATGRDLDEVSIKSAALASENFMLAIAAQGFDTCPMEGFDECRVKKILSAPFGARIVMVISVGERDPKGIWGAQFRLPLSAFMREL
jgi:nitroreductase